MAQYLISYLGGNPPATPEEGKAHYAKYQAWIRALGERAVSPMNPIKSTYTIRSDGSIEATSVTQMSGYTIIETNSIEDAIEVARRCPFLEIGGTLEVSEQIEMRV